VLTRALPLVALLGLVLLAVALVNLVARSQSDRALMWARWLAVALVIPGGYVGAVNGTILNFDSPSQALTSAWVLAWTVLVVIVVTAERSSVWLWGTLALLAFAVTGGKVSAGVVIAIGIGFAAVVGIITRRQWRKPVLIAAVVTGAAVGLAGLYFAWGSASPGDLRFLQWDGPGIDGAGPQLQHRQTRDGVRDCRSAPSYDCSVGGRHVLADIPILANSNGALAWIGFRAGWRASGCLLRPRCQ